MLLHQIQKSDEKKLIPGNMKMASYVDVMLLVFLNYEETPERLMFQVTTG